MYLLAYTYIVPLMMMILDINYLTTICEHIEQYSIKWRSKWEIKNTIIISNKIECVNVCYILSPILLIDN